MQRAIPLVLALAPFASPSAGVTPATPADFGPGTVIETFEHVVNFGLPQDYIPFDGGLLTYGTVPLDYAFPSGVALTGISSGPQEAAWLFDWSLSYHYYQLWYLGPAGGTVHGETPLPSGTAFLAHKNETLEQPLEFTLPVPALRVGMCVEVWENGSAMLRAFDAQGALLGEHTVVTNGVDLDGVDTFLGIQSDLPIHRVELLAKRAALDDFMFEPHPAVSYGGGCAGSGGFVPGLQASGTWQPGTTVGIHISQGLGGSSALLMLGTSAVDLPVGSSGCSLLVAPIVTIFVLPLSGTGPGDGGLSLRAVLPPAASVGAMATLQAWVLDPATSLGGAASNGVQVTIQP